VPGDHANKRVTHKYAEGLHDDADFCKDWAEKIGLGFNLPSRVEGSIGQHRQHQTPNAQPVKAAWLIGDAGFSLAPRARFELATLRLTAETNENLSALSGVAYEKLGAMVVSRFFRTFVET